VLFIVVAIGGLAFGEDAARGAVSAQLTGLVAREARTIEMRVSRFDWIVGEDYSAIDMVIFPAIQLLRRALTRPEAQDLAGRFLPIEANYPALGRWLQRIESLPGYEHTVPPSWRIG
jgi:glutathione S-transferase